MIKRLSYIVGLLLLAGFFSSCVSMRKVPEGQSMLYKNKVALTNPDHDISEGDLELLIKQPEQRHFWVFSPKLWFYSRSKDHKNNWWNRTLRRLGEPPVILDSNLVEISAEQMLLYLNTKGHFEPQVDFSIQKKKKGKRAEVTYHVQSGSVYRLRDIQFKVEDDSLQPYLVNWSANTLLKKGMTYDVSLLDNERDRITAVLKEAGFFAFNKDYIAYDIDSSLQSNEMDVTLKVKKAALLNAENQVVGSTAHKKYYINNVYVSTANKTNASADNQMTMDTTCFVSTPTRHDSLPHTYYFLHSEALKIAPSTVAEKVFLTPGNVFRTRDMEQSYMTLSDLKMYRSIYINAVEQTAGNTTENNLLDCMISLVPLDKHVGKVEAELLTYTSSEYGVAGNISYQNRNIFGHAEIFSLRLRGALDMQLSDLQAVKDVFHTYELQVEAGLELPRFLAPISQDRISKTFRPKTVFTVGYNFQNRRDNYVRSIVNASFGYTWRNRKIFHSLFPIEANTIKIRPEPAFQAMLDAMAAQSPRLKYQYEDHFILNARYVFVYNGQTSPNRGFNYMRASVETAGNVLNFASQLVNASKNEDGMYQFFYLSYAQYARFNLDVKRHFSLGVDKTFVLRGLFGVGFPYGNSVVLPYEKGFYGGGGLNMRAWPLYQLGPGSYANSEGSKMERIGDNIITLNAEFRFPIYKIFKGALFVDAGNVWLNSETSQYLGGEFNIDKFISEMAVGGGVGLRLDFDFFLVRLDLASKLRDPARASNERWIIDKFRWKDLVLNFGIGYPF